MLPRPVTPPSPRLLAWLALAALLAPQGCASDGVAREDAGSADAPRLDLPALPDSAAEAAAPARALKDRPDDQSGAQIHVVYALPADGADRALDTSGAIATSVAAFNGWLAAQTGGPALRLDTHQGALDVSFVRLASNEAQLTAKGAYVRDAIEAELKAAGFDAADKLYAVFYDGGSSYACGGGAWPPSLPGSVAALYLRGTPPGAPACATNALASSAAAPGYLDFALLHEIFHTLGAVATCAPHHTLSGHVSDDPTDLMYAGTQPWYPSKLDVGRDDYYGHGKAGCLDLAASAYLTAGAAP